MLFSDRNDLCRSAGSARYPAGLIKMEQAMESGSYRKMLKLTDGAYREEQLEKHASG